MGGRGQIGSAIAHLFNCDWVDLYERHLTAGAPYGYLHVTIRCLDQNIFIRDVKLCQETLAPNARIVVHSTVPLGTCGHLWAVHSPMRGTHPNLFAGLMKFTKYFGGPFAAEIAELFQDLGVHTHAVSSSRDCEALKLWDTLQFGVQIRLMQAVHAYCKRHHLDFELVYAEANHSYNDAYAEMGQSHVVRPALNYQGPGIGGHCVLPNAELIETYIADFVRLEPEEQP
jgi:UDP-N-acetyl-D-mannosaminuronate dehydrogenase